jgi:hypothetical protein
VPLRGACFGQQRGAVAPVTHREDRTADARQASLGHGGERLAAVEPEPDAPGRRGVAIDLAVGVSRGMSARAGCAATPPMRPSAIDSASWPCRGEPIIP